MRIIIILLVGMVLWAGCTNSSTSSTAEVSGAEIYQKRCVLCHGMDGKGDGAATRNPEKSIYPYDLVKSLLDEKQMFLYVKYGGSFWGTRKNDMPSWSKKYDDYTMKSVVKYIKTELKEKNK